jgi:hypothetical protein
VVGNWRSNQAILALARVFESVCFRACCEVKMPFDIHDPLVDDEGYVDDVAVERYQCQLQRLFSASPEACELRRMGDPRLKCV